MGMLISGKELRQLDQELEEAGKLSRFLEINTLLGLKTFMSSICLSFYILEVYSCVTLYC